MKVGFIGAGRMAQAMGKGMVGSGQVSASDITISDPNPQAIESFRELVGDIAVAENNEACASDQSLLILAVKPQYFEAAIQSVDLSTSDTVVVSIMGGVRIDAIKDAVSTSKVIRIMPNTPMMVGAGAAAISADPSVETQIVEQLIAMMSRISTCIKVPEKLLDSVTGLSGSGPAFVFTFIQSLADGGVLMGLPRDDALKLATQTVLGAAQLVKETGLHPSVLTDQVASPGGTTIHGIQALEESGFRAATIAAVEAAAKHSEHLGKQA